MRETDASILIGDLPKIEADYTQLVQLFQDLFSNALKFRKTGERPTIRVTSRPQGSGSLEDEKKHFVCLKRQVNAIGYQDSRSFRKDSVLSWYRSGTTAPAIAQRDRTRVAHTISGVLDYVFSRWEKNQNQRH